MVARGSPIYLSANPVKPRLRVYVYALHLDFNLREILIVLAVESLVPRFFFKFCVVRVAKHLASSFFWGGRFIGGISNSKRYI